MAVEQLSRHSRKRALLACSRQFIAHRLSYRNDYRYTFGDGGLHFRASEILRQQIPLHLYDAGPDVSDRDCDSATLRPRTRSRPARYALGRYPTAIGILSGDGPAAPAQWFSPIAERIA